MSANQATAKAVLIQLAKALLETVEEAGRGGAPAGPMYMACMGHGISLEVFQDIMGALVTLGKVRKSGHVYYSTKVVP